MKTSPSTPPAEAASQRQGRLEAEQFDRRLREDEQRELTTRWGSVFPQPDLYRQPEASRQELAARLRESQAEAERFERFHRAVSQSLGWRMLQALRRPFGRTW